MNAFLKKHTKICLKNQILRPFSSHKLSPTKPNKELTNALRILNLVTPKTSSTHIHNLRSHLQLIDDILNNNNYAIKPLDSSTFKTATSITSDSSVLMEHEHGLGFDVCFLSRALSTCASNRDFLGGIQYHCLCGAIDDAVYIFENMAGSDVVTWNSMIAGYAQHGLAQEAIDLFEEMMKQGVTPDAVTYLGVLSSCRHGGLVKEAHLYFNSMVEHGVPPELDHYSCIVDLLGRAGLLREAHDFIQNMPIGPNAVIWGSLLNSSRLHGYVWIGIQAAESRLLLEPGCPATLLQLANLYASVGWWNQVARVRKLMKDRGLKPNPGCSWIEVKSKVHIFEAQDKSNSRMTEIHLIMHSLIDHMSSSGLQSHV
ncbi:unnamed protein product [Lupinus luteus]|uniref:Pentatricopeptide repeat-containing protein n=1 Tax=Lupinus luteus TaxID=3873 RepID=A0AAV1XBU5_LUPLU